MSHYDEAERRLDHVPTYAHRAILHALLAVCDAIGEAGARRETEKAPIEPSAVEWHVYDHEDESTAPHKSQWGEVLWIVEQFYVDGVTVGVYDGVTFRVAAVSGSDDCSVSHWAYIANPRGPEEAS